MTFKTKLKKRKPKVLSYIYRFEGKFPDEKIKIVQKGNFLFIYKNGKLQKISSFDIISKK